MKQNIVYLLTNTNKDEGRRFYIGSKQEATLEVFDGVMTILDRNDKPYYSSSTSIEMREEMLNGDVFEASVLEYVKDKKQLLAIEDKYINQFNAVESEEYYNKSNALMNVHDQGAVANKYGETVKDLANRNSSWGKRDNMAKSLGFKDFGELHFWIHAKLKEGYKHAEVSKLLGKHRHFTITCVKGIDLDKAQKEVEQYKGGDMQNKIRKYILLGCSLFYACELLGLEITSGRVLVGDFNKAHQKSFKASLKKGLSKDEMEKRIVQIVYDCPKVGNGFKDAAKELDLSIETVRRYFIRYIKENMRRPE